MGHLIYLLVLASANFAFSIVENNSTEITVGQVAEVRSTSVWFGDFQYLTYPKATFDPKKFTIVYMPGGPGGASSDFYAKHFAIESSREDIQYLFIDPRGTGLNLKLGEVTGISSWQTATDVMAVLKSEGLSDFIIWGQSYGTVTTTMLTYQFERQTDVPLPKAVVLMGTLGSAEANEQGESFDIISKDFLSRLPPESRLLLGGIDSSFRLDKIISTALTLNDDKRLDFFNTEVRKGIVDAVPASEESREIIYEELDNYTKGFFLGARIVCSEFTIINYTEEIRLGTFEGIPFLCTHENESIYDSKNFQITKTPVIYMQGLNDWQTPLPSALHHYVNQNSLAPGSSFSLVFGTAHKVFSNLFESCLDPFLQDLKNSDFQLSRAHSCADKNGVAIKRY